MVENIDIINFDEHIYSGKLVIIDFHSKLCDSYKNMTEVIDELSNDFNNRVIIGRLDIECDSRLFDRYNIKNIDTPTIMFFKDGEIVDRTIGSVSKTQLADMINSHI